LATDPVDPFRGRSDDQAAREAMDRAMKEVLNRNPFDVLRNLSPDQIIPANPKAEIIKGTANPAGGWLHSPGHFEGFAATDERLTNVSALAGMPVTQVEKVLAFLIKGTKIVVIKPTYSNDPTGIPVTRTAGASSVWINLITLLAEPRLTVPTGYRVRYEVAYVPEGSPLWPGICLDLDSPKERRRKSPKKAPNSFAPDVELDTEDEADLDTEAETP